jgi:hypothetical protein
VFFGGVRCSGALSLPRGTKNFAQDDNDVVRLIHRYRLAVQLRVLAYYASVRHALRYEQVNPGLVCDPPCAGSASKRKPACVMPARLGARKARCREQRRCCNAVLTVRSPLRLSTILLATLWTSGAVVRQRV